MLVWKIDKSFTLVQHFIAIHSKIQFRSPGKSQVPSSHTAHFNFTRSKAESRIILSGVPPAINSSFTESFHPILILFLLIFSGISLQLLDTHSSATRISERFHLTAFLTIFFIFFNITVTLIITILRKLCMFSSLKLNLSVAKKIKTYSHICKLSLLHSSCTL